MSIYSDVYWSVHVERRTGTRVDEAEQRQDRAADGGRTSHIASEGRGWDSREEGVTDTLGFLLEPCRTVGQGTSLLAMVPLRYQAPAPIQSDCKRETRRHHE